MSWKYAYGLYSKIVTAGEKVNLSPLFLQEGVARPGYRNVEWALVIQDEGTTLLYSGLANSDGSLAQGDAPSDFIFTMPETCNMVAELIVYFKPDPDKPCADCQTKDPSNQQSCSASSQTSGSVELATGKFVFQKELLSILGLGSGSWSFDLNYKSNYDIEGILGKNFAYPQYMHLEQLAGGAYFFKNNVQMVTDQLSRAIFDYVDDETYSTSDFNSTRGTLIRTNAYSSSERLIFTSADGTVTTFFGFNYFGGDFDPSANVSVPAPGQIESIVDRHGNQQTLVWGNTHTSINGYGQTVYDGTPQLLSVTDAYGRTVNYSYYGAEGGYRLQQITDFLGRQLNFQYDSEDRLVAAITPSILKAAPGNTFPGGTAYVFQYDSGNANPARRDDLIRIWYPNQTQPYLNVETRTVDVAAVYASATPRYQVTYGQSIGDLDTYGKVLTETLGDPENEIGGTATFDYTTCPEDLPTNIIDDSEAGTIVSRTIYTDRNGNRTLYDFNAGWTVSRMEVQLNRNKNSLELDNEDNGGVATPPFVTWTKFNAQNQPLAVVYPEGNSVEYTYDTGMVYSGDSKLYPYVPRVGLLLSETKKPGNSISLPHRDGSNDQATLTKRYFYEPLFNRLCAIIDERGNPINGGTTYFTPQNGGTTPTNSNRSRYATIYTFDYQKDASATITGDTDLQALLGLSSTQIGYLISYVDGQMTATDGTGGIPSGFPINLGDINGDGTGDGASSDLPAATHLGNQIKITHPSVLLVGGTTQNRIELFTVNDRGQITTATDPEGNLTVTTRYPENDPEGSGQNVSSTLSTQQYGLVREIHKDADPADVMSLVGASGDLVNFVRGLITRTNTPGVYQDLVTRYEGSPNSGEGCVTCGYDAMGNVLSETDPRGFTTIYDRNEVGEVYRVTSSSPYNFKVETSYDANRNVIQVDTEDRQVQYNSPDPTDAGYGTFTPMGSNSTAHVPTIPGPGGPLRPGWFSNLMTYDILDNKIEEDIDATGSTPGNLITRYEYDANQNLTKIIKPEGNLVEYDYDERNLKIAERVGYYLNPDDPEDPLSSPGAVTAYSYDGNKNLLNIIGPVDHNADGDTPGATSLTAYIVDAFGSGSMITASGDWVLQNIYDGFNRVITAVDAVGGETSMTYDPTSNLIQKEIEGAISGSPTDHSGDENVSLANSYFRYDEALRLYEEQKDVFMPDYADWPLPSGRDVTHTGGGLAANSTANDHTGTVTLTTGGTSYVLSRNVYDRAGRVTATLADNTAQTSYAYDGAGRQILLTDPLGNTVATAYDGNGNPVKVTRTEVCTITSPTVANEIFISFTWFDCLNRPVVSGTQGADGLFCTNLNLCCPWQGLPSTLFSLLGYDSRGNRTTVTDPKGNVVVSIYDGASRLIETQQEMRLNGDGRAAPAPNQTFLTAGGGVIRTEYVYDGNSRLVELADDRGGSTVYDYDTLDRLITRTLADGSVSTRVYDLSGVMIWYYDESGNTAHIPPYSWALDALGRPLARDCGGAGTSGDVYQSSYYDGLSRYSQLANRDVVVAIDTSVFFYYDSLGRVLEEKQTTAPLYITPLIRYTTHTAFTSLPATQVTYPSDIVANNTYDALYRRKGVTGKSGATTLDSVGWQFFGPQRIVETIWGSNSLIATQMNNARTHSAVQSGVALPAWGDVSSDRLGYDGSGRMITKRYLLDGINGTTHAYNNTSALVGYTTGYDRTGNKLYERHFEAESRSHLYQPFNDDGSFAPGYDSANRLTQYQRGVLSSTIIPFRSGPGASITTPITLPGANQVMTYGLDGLGNWKTNNRTTVIDEETTLDTAEERQHNYVNEITSVLDTPPGGTPTPFEYDHGDNADTDFPLRGNGNLVNDGVRIYLYDALGRLVQVSRVSDSAVIATYSYDFLNRRVRKVISNGGLTGDIPNGITDYLYDGDQIIEERTVVIDVSDTFKKANFWGQYIDELLFFTVPTTTTYRVLSDLLYRSVAIVTTSNVISEAYDTDAYGNTLCFSAPGSTWWFSDNDTRTNNPINTTIFTGRQYDPETQIYYYRARYYSPNIGRFISRDPLPDAELSQGPNLYWYVQDNPANAVDPWGFDSLATLDSGGTRQNVSRADLEKLMSPTAPLPPNILKDLNRGCIGLACAYQGKGQTFPENAPGTKCFLTEGEAEAVQCPPNEKNFVFAKQGQWSNGDPTPDPTTGQVPNNSISNVGGNYNYITTFSSTKSYAWMNNGVYNGAPPQVGTIAPFPTNDPHYPHTIWCSTCIPCNS